MVVYLPLMRDLTLRREGGGGGERLGRPGFSEGGKKRGGGVVEPMHPEKDGDPERRERKKKKKPLWSQILFGEEGKKRKKTGCIIPARGAAV